MAIQENLTQNNPSPVMNLKKIKKVVSKKKILPFLTPIIGKKKTILDDDIIKHLYYPKIWKPSGVF